MKIKEATFTRRFTTGQYEFEEHTLSAEADESGNEKGSEILLELKKEVLEAFTGEVKDEDTKPDSSKNRSKSKKSSTSEDEGANDEGSEDNEASDDKTSDDDNSEPEASEGSDREEKEDQENDEPREGKAGKSKSKSKESSKDEKSKKTFQRKPQHYDRSIEEHKNIFARVYTSISPDWRKSEAGKKKAKIISEKVEGEPFLDENGEVLDSFTARVRKLNK